MFARYGIIREVCSRQSLLIICLLLGVALGVSAASAAASAAAVAISVDTTLDSNAAAYQICSSAPNDCSLRGAISRANANTGNAYILQLPAGAYRLTLAACAKTTMPPATWTSSPA